jgi:hypothetical protein
MSLVIRKKITCEFLGDEYKDAYLVFKAIPVSELADIQKSLPIGETDEDKVQVIPKMLEILKKYFLNGKFPDDKGELEDVTSADLDNMNADLAIHCFQGLSGVEPNLDLESRNSSTPSTPKE